MKKEKSFKQFLREIFTAKTFVLLAIVFTLTVMLGSCGRGITVQDAANGRARCGMHLK